MLNASIELKGNTRDELIKGLDSVKESIESGEDSTSDGKDGEWDSYFSIEDDSEEEDPEESEEE